MQILQSIDRSLSTQRVRVLDCWSLVKFAYGTVLTGMVIEDSAKDIHPDATMRLTKTSPVVAIEGRTFITESGSRYTVKNPHPGQSDLDAADLSFLGEQDS